MSVNQDPELKAAFRIGDDGEVPKVAKELYDACQYACGGLGGNSEFTPREMALICGIAKCLMDREEPPSFDLDTNGSATTTTTATTAVPFYNPYNLGDEVVAQLNGNGALGKVGNRGRQGKIAVVLYNDPEGKKYRLFDPADVKINEPVEA